MKAHLPPYDMAQLGDAVARAVHDAFQDRTRVEPQLVANLVSALPKYVNRISFSGPTKMKAGGVFVHAQPFVACASFPDKTKASVEIGDLLLIRTLVVNNKIEERRALLLQAKKDRIPSTPDNPNQWHLYEQWPRFTYAAKSGRLTGKKRHINESDMYEAAKYLLIGDDAARHHRRGMCCVDWPFRWLKHGPDICGHHTAQPTKPHISRYRCFVGELVEFLAGNAGKVFDKPASRTRGWNRVVHDLITETARAKTIFMGRAAQTSIKYPRGSGVLFMALAAQSRHFMVAGGGGAEVFDGTTHEPPDVPEHWLSDSDRDGGGISIIEVVIEDEGPARD